MKLPKAVYSQQGPVPVGAANTIADKSAFGEFDAAQRKIDIDPSPCPNTQLGTLFHEMVHVAMYDSGASVILQALGTKVGLDDKLEELVCDAVGGYLTAAALAGYLTVKEPK